MSSSGSNMEVDDAPTAAAAAIDGGDGSHKALEVHPLALVHMSDHYTRIKCGGSPLPKTSPVVGLLFGFDNEILDADDISVAINNNSSQQVSLHQAVFPTHKVVGWYRVSSSSTVVEKDDVLITQALQQHYGHSIMFCLLQVSSEESKESKNQQEEEELPLMIYKLEDNSSNNAAAVLVQVSQKWQLATTEPERIAIERVVREQPSLQKNQKMNPTSKFATHVGTVEQAVDSMKDRLLILTNYLQAVVVQAANQDKVPTDDLHLLREIQGLVYRLGPLQQDAPSSNSSTALMSQLAAVAKTVNAVEGYTDKFRTVYESRNPNASRDAGAAGSSVPRRF